MTQRVTVQCFGMLQQVCGGPNQEVQVAGLPIMVADVLKRLEQDIPALSAHLGHTACAVGDHFVGRDAYLHEGDMLVLLPPVSGG